MYVFIEGIFLIGRQGEMKVLANYIFMMILPISGCGIEENIGHRGGCKGSLYKEHKLIENSMECLEAALQGLDGKSPNMNKESFHYLEADIRTTCDRKLVVYHGNKHKVFSGQEGDHATIKDTPKNRTVLRLNRGRIYCKEDSRNNTNPSVSELIESLRVNDIHSDTLLQLHLEDDQNQHIPTVKEYVDLIVQQGLTKPVMFDLKDVNCDANDVELSPAHQLIGESNRILMFPGGGTNHSEDTSFEAQRKVGFLLVKGKKKGIGGASGAKCWCEALQNIDIRHYATYSSGLKAWFGKPYLDVCKE